MKNNTDLGLLILRITVAGLMLFHGVAKLSHLDGIKRMLSEVGLPEFIAYGVFITELIAPILMIIGYMGMCRLCSSRLCLANKQTYLELNCLY